MESSDESFAWTDASSDSGKDSVTDMKQNKKEPDSESSKENHRKKSKNKLSDHDEYNRSNKSNKSIKSEQNIDFEIGTSDNYDESLQEADDYLNLRVKQEQATFVKPTPKKTKKKKKAKEEPEESEDQSELELLMQPKQEIDIEQYHLDNDSCLVNGDNSEISEIYTSNRKKKKKKKNRLSIENEASELIAESADSCEMNKKKGKKKLHNNVSDIDNFHHGVENGEIISSTLIQNSIQEDVKENDDDNSDIQSSLMLENNIESPNRKSKKNVESSKKSLRISDRLRFEEDSIDFESKDVPKSDISIQLQQFTISNINLKPLPVELHSGPEISDDDEIWILKGPHDISVRDLEKTNLILDGKKKIKINGNTYDTFVDTTVNSAPMLLFNHRKVLLKNIPLKGIINLRKRIPRLHIPYESLMMINNNSFIPLPETKCRHPLFGVHYRKAAKVPPVIAKRLKSTNAEFNTDSKNKKYHIQKVKTESDFEVKPNKEELHPYKKKRKMTENFENESDIVSKPSVENYHSKKKKGNKTLLEIESDIDMNSSIEVLHSKKDKRKKKYKLEMESNIEVKPSIEIVQSIKEKSSRDRLQMESESEVKPNIDALHFKKKKRKDKDDLEMESDIEAKPNIEELHLKKKKRKRKLTLDELVTESNIVSHLETSHSNKKKRKHSDEVGSSRKAKRLKYDLSSADAWESEKAIEQNLFDF